MSCGSATAIRPSASLGRRWPHLLAGLQCSVAHMPISQFAPQDLQTACVPPRWQVTSLSAELADARQRAREERRQLSLELASTRTEAAAAAERAGERAAALADAQGIIEELTARLRRCGATLSQPCTNHARELGLDAVT